YMGDAIEKQMAHDKKSSIRAVYNHAQHLEERRKIMQVGKLNNYLVWIELLSQI
ncbi:hypothetical protein LCGC14_1486390, partial [marine sediment metagenome]